jgi:hypothetical protein
MVGQASRSVRAASGPLVSVLVLTGVLPVTSRSALKALASSSTSAPVRLSSYFAAGFGAATGMLALAPAEAAVVAIDIGPSGFNIAGVNAGLGYGSTTVANFPLTSAGSLKLYGLGDSNQWGLAGIVGLEFAVNSTSPVSPRNFSPGSTVDGSALFQTAVVTSVFRYGYGAVTSAPDFGPGSYLGFKTSQNNYGWLEVTWNNASADWEVLSGAYESVPNTGIGVPVPEPLAAGVAGVAALAVGSAAIRRLRRAQLEQPCATD